MAKIKNSKQFYIGTAGWSLPKQVQSLFPTNGTHLQKYSQVFNAVEINSAFYKNHKAATYAKWAAETPEHFRFSVKLNKYFIHEKRFLESGEFLKETLKGLQELGPKLAVLLIQLPPSLEFDSSAVQNFLIQLREMYSGQITFEPRHISWGKPKALELLRSFDISKVIADPEPCPVSDHETSQSSSLQYIRWHGSPEVYRSRYSLHALQTLSENICHQKLSSSETWVIFDNTTFGYATENALELKQLIQA